MTTQRNEAAERLREMLNLHADDWAGAEPGWMDAYLDEALATERRVTVERVRESLTPLAIAEGFDGRLQRILDDISKEGTP